jgi:hypothetical protein
MSLKSLKIVQNASDYWRKKSPFLFECFKEASIPLKIYLKSLPIFEKKTLTLIKNGLDFSENVFKKNRNL